MSTRAFYMMLSAAALAAPLGLFAQKAGPQAPGQPAPTMTQQIQAQEQLMRSAYEEALKTNVAALGVSAEIKRRQAEVSAYRAEADRLRKEASALCAHEIAQRRQMEADLKAAVQKLEPPLLVYLDEAQADLSKRQAQYDSQINDLGGQFAELLEPRRAAAQSRLSETDARIAEVGEALAGTMLPEQAALNGEIEALQARMDANQQAIQAVFDALEGHAALRIALQLKGKELEWQKQTRRKLREQMLQEMRNRGK